MKSRRRSGLIHKFGRELINAEKSSTRIVSKRFRLPVMDELILNQDQIIHERLMRQDKTSQSQQLVYTE